MNKLYGLSHLIQKEFLQIRRNAFIPRLIVMFPIMIMCVMPWVMNMEITNIRVEVVDNDRSSLSAQLVHRIEASRYFIFCGQKASYAEAMADIDDGKTDAIVDIPHNFEKQTLCGERPQIYVAANSVNGTKGSMALSYLSQIIGRHLGDYATNGSVLTSTSVDGLVSTLYLYNKHLNYKVFMIPSLMAILLLLICGFLPALNIVGEKEAGTIEAINVTPVSRAAFILSKLIPYWIIALVVMSGLWHNVSGQYPALLSAGNTARTDVQRTGTHHLQLQRDDATGGVRHVVYRGKPHPAQRSVHSSTLHAPLGLPHYVRQPHALLHRCHTHGICAWRRLPVHRPPSSGPSCLCHRRERMGRTELPKARCLEKHKSRHSESCLNAGFLRVCVLRMPFMDATSHCLVYFRHVLVVQHGFLSVHHGLVVPYHRSCLRKIRRHRLCLVCRFGYEGIQ